MLEGTITEVTSLFDLQKTKKEGVEDSLFS